MTLGKFRSETKHLHDDVLVFINVGHPEDASEDIVDTSVWEIHGGDENELNEAFGISHISLFVPIDEKENENA